MRTTPKMGLYSWDQLGDNYNFAQLAQNFQTLDYHDHTAGRGSQIAAGGLSPGAVLSSNIASGQIGFQHLSQTLAQDMGVNIAGSNGQGYVNISPSQSTTSTVYTTLSTPDLVSVTITTGGLIFVAYQAAWASSVASAGNAAIFLNSIQVAGAISTFGAPQVQFAVTSSTSNIVRPLVTQPFGLISDTSATNFTGNVTTGQILGDAAVGNGMCAIFAAPGTYNVSIQFKASSGSVTASTRQLWVWTRNFN